MISPINHRLKVQQKNCFGKCNKKPVSWRDRPICRYLLNMVGCEDLSKLKLWYIDFFVVHITMKSTMISEEIQPKRKNFGRFGWISLLRRYISCELLTFLYLWSSSYSNIRSSPFLYSYTQKKLRGAGQKGPPHFFANTPSNAHTHAKRTHANWKY